MLTGPDPLPSVTIESGTRLRPSHMSSQPLTLPPSPRFSHSFARHLVYLQPCPYSSSLHRLPPPPPSERMSFLQSFAVGLLSYARRKPFRSMAWLSFIHWVLNFARRFYNRIANDRYIRKIPSPKALLHPILGMVPSLAVSLTGTVEHGNWTWAWPHIASMLLPRKHTGERSLPPYPATASLVLLRKAFSRLPPHVGSYGHLPVPPSASRPPLILGRPYTDWVSRTRFFAPHHTLRSFAHPHPLRLGRRATRHSFCRTVRLL